MRLSFPETLPDEGLADDSISMSRLFTLVLILGFVIRLFACQYTCIVNPDGALYIHQARAIYYGQWDLLSSCVLNFVSSYPLFIIGGYTIFHNWIISARVVSLIFGSMTLIPVYFLLRRFLDGKTCILSVLVFAVTPLFVARSADVIRDPIYWFFAALGLYFFISSDQVKYRLPTLFASLSFIMAAWARIEAILYIIISCVVVLVVRQGKKAQRIAIFISPVILLMLLLFAGLSVFDISTQSVFRLEEIRDKLSEPLVQYENLRAGLKDLVSQTPDSNLAPFLKKARNMIWLIALGTVAKHAVDAYFYPFFVLFLMGLAGARRRLKEDTRVLYLALNSAFALFLLYAHLMQTWMIFHRFAVLFLLPSFVFLGFGMKRMVYFLEKRFSLKAPVTLFIIAISILICSLPKNLQSNESDKLVFKEIGQLIADLEGNDREIGVAAASLWTMSHVSFYANLKYEGAICPLKYINIQQLARNSDDAFLSDLKKAGVDYFLWEEKSWSKNRLDFLKRQTPNRVIEIGRWSHADTGRLVLFKVITG
ncbi:MAG: glycosyltransferase family 39 protein [Deltaproteobacteria bacterium]|nr:glycosyltransferase family 39 protein [Deltaproteobacteria bacterium]